MPRFLKSWKFWAVVAVVFGVSFLIGPQKLPKPVAANSPEAAAGQVVGIGYDAGKPVCVKDAKRADANPALLEAYRAGGGKFVTYQDKPEPKECGIHPDEEFDLGVPQNTLVSIPAVGPLDFSITKPVVYLLIATLLLCGGAILISMRLKLDPTKTQTTAEALYGFARDQIVGVVMPEQARARWFPYIATLLLFIYVSNVIGFIPLPLGAEGDPGLNWGIYAAAANINVPLGLALVTFFASHYMGIRSNGVRHYFGSWGPPGIPLAARIPLGLLHGISELGRPITLMVRLFANLLAGHLLIAVLVGLVFVFGTFLVLPVFGGIALVLYLFEVILVCAVQAYIFAILSAVYIGGAIELEH